MILTTTQLINNAELRITVYKNTLTDLYKHKDIFNDETLWFKDFIRDMKNFEQSRLKHLLDEKSHENSKINPPFIYKKTNKHEFI